MQWLGNISEDLKLSRHMNDCESRLATWSCWTQYNMEMWGSLFQKQGKKFFLYSIVSLWICHGAFICHLLLHSLGHRDTYRMRGDPHRHPGVLPCNSVHILNLDHPHTQGLSAVSAVGGLAGSTRVGGSGGQESYLVIWGDGGSWDHRWAKAPSPSTWSIFPQTSLTKYKFRDKN